MRYSSLWGNKRVDMDYLIFPDAIHMKHQQNPEVWECGLDGSVRSSAAEIKRNLELLVWSEVHGFVRRGKAWGLWIRHRAKIHGSIFSCFSSPASSLPCLLAQHVVLALALYWLTYFRGPSLVQYTIPFSRTMHDGAVIPVHPGNQSVGGTPPFPYFRPQFYCSSLSSKT